MERSKAKKIKLASLSNGMPGVTTACGKMLAESAAVCLEDREHQTGIQLFVVGMKTCTVQLEWLAVDEQRKRCYNDMQEATEWGACCVAILLVKELTGKVVVERSRKGPGFDYWIGEEDDDVLFRGKARLEVSGILFGTTAQIDTRVKQKKAQIKLTDHLAPGYVAVVEFGNPMAHVEATPTP